MSWFALLLAGLFEVLGVLWLNEYARQHQKRFI
ncbi:QacE family quaternary ammonium compound efflux SMR transporter, partial [Staphylococcus pseudintermedius]